MRQPAGFSACLFIHSGWKRFSRYRFGVPEDSHDGSSTSVAPLQLTAVTTLCGQNTCPTVYTSDRGTLVVQGYRIPPADAGLDVPDGELLVEIPVDLLREAARLLT
jgi:hypothetical protein